MSRAIVFSGHETWEEREFPEPEPPIGGAVLRVEATRLCHSDVDHFRGNIHTSWGGAFPSVPGHEIVGRIDKIRLGDGSRMGCRRGRPRCGARRSPRRRIDILRASELRGHVGGAGAAR